MVESLPVRKILSSALGKRGVHGKRYELMSTSPKFQAGKNFMYYGMKPKFILVDEWAASSLKLIGIIAYKQKSPNTLPN